MFSLSLPLWQGSTIDDYRGSHTYRAPGHILCVLLVYICARDTELIAWVRFR